MFFGKRHKLLDDKVHNGHFILCPETDIPFCNFFLTTENAGRTGDIIKK